MTGRFLARLTCQASPEKWRYSLTGAFGMAAASATQNPRQTRNSGEARLQEIKTGEKKSGPN